jgi:hypothetical protein
MSRKPDQRSTLEWKLAEIAYPKAPKLCTWRFRDQLSEALRNNGAPIKLMTLLSKLYDLGITPSQGEHPLAQIYRVEISNFRHNHVLPLQHNAAQFYS